MNLRRPNPAVRVRVVSTCVMVMALAPSAIALFLRAEPAGLGTHQQLGLPPCSLRVLLDLRCPACGMTTAWTHCVAGRFADAARVNLGGLLIFAAALLAVLQAIRCGVLGKPPSRARVRQFAFLLVGIGCITLTDWLIRIAG